MGCMPPKSHGWRKSSGALPTTLPDPWKTLLRGLLTNDPEKRWGGDEVQKWLSGESPAVFFEEEKTPDRAEEWSGSRISPYPFLGKNLFYLADLAKEFQQSPAAWEEAKGHLLQGYPVDWLEKTGNREKAQELKIVLSAEPVSDWSLFRILRRWCPEGAIFWRGELLRSSRISHILHEAVADAMEVSWQEWLEKVLFSGVGGETVDFPMEADSLKRLAVLGRGLMKTPLHSLAFRDRCLVLFLVSEGKLARENPIHCLQAALKHDREAERHLLAVHHDGFREFAIEAGSLSLLQGDLWQFVARTFALSRDGHPDLEPALENIVVLSLRDSLFESADFFGRRLLTLEEGRKPRSDPRRLGQHLLAIGRANLELNRFSEAEACFQRAETTYSEAGKAANLDLAETLGLLGLLCQRLERREEAVSYWRRTLGIYQKVLPASDERVKAAQQALIMLAEAPGAPVMERFPAGTKLPPGTR